MEAEDNSASIFSIIKLTMFRLRCIVFVFCFFAVVQAQPGQTGKLLPTWEKGFLDIHHINTGRGSAAYFIFPDGTTMLFDAGEIPPTDSRVNTPSNATIKPNNEKKPYEWIVSYVNKVCPPQGKKKIDYVVTSHFHDDHFGSWYSGAPRSRSSKFILSGITGVGDYFQFGILTDRAAPDYNYPVDFKKPVASAIENSFDKTITNYFSFIDEKKTAGMQLQQFRAGSNKQFVLVNNPLIYPDFEVRNIKSNGKIWTGKDSTIKEHFPPVDTSKRFGVPDENSLSIAIKIRYGAFTYYTGGDNAGVIIPGDNPLRDVETEIAEAVGEVDVATMDHHGNRDAVNENMVSNLRPRVWIGQTWSSDHPGHEVLLRVTNKNIYPFDRDLFATNMLEANKIVIGPLIDRSYSSQQGHIVVRVMPDRKQYYIIILDDSSAEMLVKSMFGPYQSKEKN
jgi:beta-lactamase superfamily II metal-dependent hydrolase